MTRPKRDKKRQARLTFEPVGGSSAAITAAAPAAGTTSSSPAPVPVPKPKHSYSPAKVRYSRAAAPATRSNSSVSPSSRSSPSSKPSAVRTKGSRGTRSQSRLQLGSSSIGTFVWYSSCAVLFGDRVGVCEPSSPPFFKKGRRGGERRPRAIALCECLNRGWMFSVVQLVLPGLYEQPCNINTGGWLLLLYTCFGLYGVTCKAPLWIYSHVCRFFCCSNITSYATSRKFHAKGPWRQEACYVGRLLG